MPRPRLMLTMQQRTRAAAVSWAGEAPAAPVAGDGAPPHAAPRTPLQSVARGALALLSTQPITWATSIASVMFLPHLLGAAGLGRIAVILVIVALVELLACFGIPEYLSRRMATSAEEGRAEGNAAIVLMTSLAVLLAVAVWCGAWAMRSPAASVLLLIGLISATAGMPRAALMSMLLGREAHVRFAWFGAISGVVGTAVGLGVLMAGGSLALYMASGLPLGVFMTLLILRTAHFQFKRKDVTRQRLLQLVRGGWPFLCWNAALRVRAQIDIVVVALLVNAQVTGWLSAAYRIISIPVFIPTLITTPLLPALSRCADQPAVFQRTLRHTVLIVLGLTVPCSVLIFGMAPVLPQLLRWPDEFRNVVPLIMILSVQQPLVAIDTVLGTALFALRRERRWLMFAVGAAVFNPSMNLIIIPLFQRGMHNGAIGAAIVEVLTEVVMLVGALVLLPRGSLSRDTAVRSVKIVAAGIITAGIFVILRSQWIGYSVILATVVYPSLCWLLGVISTEELRRIKTVVFQQRLRSLVG